MIYIGNIEILTAKSAIYLGNVGYVNNLFNENALLGFDRERGGRARLGFNINTPRTYGLTVRKTF